jgi:hypothetical protein
MTILMGEQEVLGAARFHVHFKQNKKKKQRKWLMLRSQVTQVTN